MVNKMSTSTTTVDCRKQLTIDCFFSDKGLVLPLQATALISGVVFFLLILIVVWINLLVKKRRSKGKYIVTHNIHDDIIARSKTDVVEEREATPSQLLNLGYTETQLIEAGVAKKATKEQLLDAGYTKSQLREANIYPPSSVLINLKSDSDVIRSSAAVDDLIISDNRRENASDIRKSSSRRLTPTSISEVIFDSRPIAERVIVEDEGFSVFATPANYDTKSSRSIERDEGFSVFAASPANRNYETKSSSSWSTDRDEGFSVFARS